MSGAISLSSKEFESERCGLQKPHKHSEKTQVFQFEVPFQAIQKILRIVVGYFWHGCFAIGAI